MKHTVVALVVCASLGLLTGVTFAASPQNRDTPPTQAEIQQHAMEHGPATGRIGYLTHKDPPAPHREARPVDPKSLRPLTEREVGMVYGTCIAYPECKVAYAKAYEREQALIKARKAAGDDDQ